MKRLSQTTMGITYYRSISKLILITIFTITLFSCSNDDDSCTHEISEISQEIKDLIYFEGYERAPTVIINVQAGPSTVIAQDAVSFITQTFNTSGVLTVNVHQAQTQNPNILEGNEITLDQAINYNADTVDILYQVVQYFKDQGRTVYVLGISFGAFVTQELIAQKGINVADKYLIMTGRLDINDVFWQGLAEGKPAEFDNGVTPIVGTEPFDNVFNRNEARLFAALIMNRYTEDFNAIEDLSNITYIYGETDEAVGSLTDEEVTFLQSKNANVISGSGGHDEILDDFIVQGFNEAFGISNL